MTTEESARPETTAETIPSIEDVEKNIAKRIRAHRRPTGGAFDLSGEAQRLTRALKVVEKWAEATSAAGDGSGELWYLAETTRDNIEEELSRVAFQMDHRELSSRIREHTPGEVLYDVSRLSVITDTLLEAYNIIRALPDSEFGADSSRRRFGIMGTLLAGMDDASAEMERLLPSKPAGE